VQARTLELYSQIRLADAVIERGWKTIAVHLWVAGKKAAHAVFGDMGAGVSPFPYRQLRAPDIGGLAGSRVWRRRARGPGSVFREWLLKTS
jgi:hypothetical protein